MGAHEFVEYASRRASNQANKRTAAKGNQCVARLKRATVSVRRWTMLAESGTARPCNAQGALLLGKSHSYQELSRGPLLEGHTSTSFGKANELHMQPRNVQSGEANGA
jgi:hypothetical protein